MTIHHPCGTKDEHNILLNNDLVLDACGVGYFKVVIQLQHSPQNHCFSKPWPSLVFSQNQWKRGFDFNIYSTESSKTRELITSPQQWLAPFQFQNYKTRRLCASATLYLSCFLFIHNVGDTSLRNKKNCLTNERMEGGGGISMIPTNECLTTPTNSRFSNPWPSLDFSRN